MKTSFPASLLSFRGSSACGGVTPSPAVSGGGRPPPCLPFLWNGRQGVPQPQPGKWHRPSAVTQKSRRERPSSSISISCQASWSTDLRRIGKVLAKCRLIISHKNCKLGRIENGEEEGEGYLLIRTMRKPLHSWERRNYGQLGLLDLWVRV